MAYGYTSWAPAEQLRFTLLIKITRTTPHRRSLQILRAIFTTPTTPARFSRLLIRNLLARIPSHLEIFLAGQIPQLQTYQLKILHLQLRMKLPRPPLRVLVRRLQRLHLRTRLQITTLTRSSFHLLNTQISRPLPHSRCPLRLPFHF